MRNAHTHTHKHTQTHIHTHTYHHHINTEREKHKIWKQKQKVTEQHQKVLVYIYILEILQYIVILYYDNINCLSYRHILYIYILYIYIYIFTYLYIHISFRKTDHCIQSQRPFILLSPPRSPSEYFDFPRSNHFLFKKNLVWITRMYFNNVNKVWGSMSNTNRWTFTKRGLNTSKYTSSPIICSTIAGVSNPNACPVGICCRSGS